MRRRGAAALRAGALLLPAAFAQAATDNGVRSVVLSIVSKEGVDWISSGSVFCKDELPRLHDATTVYVVRNVKTFRSWYEALTQTGILTQSRRGAAHHLIEDSVPVAAGSGKEWRAHGRLTRGRHLNRSTVHSLSGGGSFLWLSLHLHLQLHFQLQ